MIGMTPEQALAEALRSLDDVAETDRIWRVMGEGILAQRVLAALPPEHRQAWLDGLDPPCRWCGMPENVTQHAPGHDDEPEYGGRHRYRRHLSDADRQALMDGLALAALREARYDVVQIVDMGKTIFVKVWGRVVGETYPQEFRGPTLADACRAALEGRT